MVRFFILFLVEPLSGGLSGTKGASDCPERCIWGCYGLESTVCTSVHFCFWISIFLIIVLSGEEWVEWCGNEKQVKPYKAGVVFPTSVRFSREEMLFCGKSSEKFILLCLLLAWKISCLFWVVFKIFFFNSILSNMKFNWCMTSC